MSVNFDLKGAFSDIMPLASRIWAWAEIHYLELMAFAIAFLLLLGFVRRKRA